MGVRWPRQLFGVEVIYIRDHIARKAVSIITGGRAVWALLPDGRVGTNDVDFFRRYYGQGSRAEVHVAEKLWRLGKMKKTEYKKLEAAYDKKKKREGHKHVCGELMSYAKQAGIVMSKQQLAIIEKYAKL